MDNNRKGRLIRPFLVYLSLLQGVLASAGEMSQDWLNLLHQQGSQPGDIANPDHFFLTKSHQAPEEMDELIFRLRQEGSGFSYACRFPARYVFLKKAGLAPIFDLSLCTDLQEFIAGFHGRRISIALAEEYFGAPSSMFGHVMIVFHNNDTPEPDSDVVHFAALSNQQDGFWSYLRKGITGGYSGEYVREPLFKKLHEYQRTEQRALFFYDFRSNEENVRFLIYHLYELRGVQFPYFFFSKNCAFHLSSLISIVTKDSPLSGDFYALPIEVLYQHKNFLEERGRVYPNLSRFLSLYSELGSSERHFFDTCISGGDCSRSMLEYQSEKLREALFLFYTYSFRRKHEILSSYNVVAKVKFQDSQTFAAPAVSGPLNSPMPKRLSVSAVVTEKVVQYGLGFRPVLADLHDHRPASSAESVLDLLETRISFSERHFSLEEMKVFHLGVSPDYSRLQKDLSWSIYFGANRGNIRRDLRLVASVGAGHTYRVGGLGRIEWSIGPEVEGDATGVYPFLVPRVRVFRNITEWMNVDLAGGYKRSFQSDYFEANLETSYFLRKWQVGVLGRLGREETERGKFVEVGINLYF